MDDDVNIVQLCDAYKFGHWMQDPKNTKKKFYYLESRGGEYPVTIFFALQYAAKKYLEGCVVTHEKIDETVEDSIESFGFNYVNEKGWRYIADELDGRLPIEIRAVPEGSIISTHNVLMTVHNTDPNCAFLPGFLESFLEMIWYPITVATKSWHVRKELKGFADKAGEPVSVVHLNDFGMRGSTSVESSMIGGAAHLVNFCGSDTFPAKRLVKQYYYGKKCTIPVLLSVYASEHSTVTAYGEDNELIAYQEILARAPENAIVSMVIDSYDAIRAIEEYIGKKLKVQILGRTGKFVVRPDSGDPKWMSLAVLNSLWNNFGGTYNEKGYKVLNQKVGVIYSDFISPQMIKDMMIEIVIKNRFAPSNIVFGMGGELLQKCNRDTLSFAYKGSAIQIGDEWYDMYKRPVSDSRKESKRGILTLVKENDNYKTINMNSLDEVIANNVLQPVFRDGEVLKEYTFDEVRRNADTIGMFSSF